MKKRISLIVVAALLLFSLPRASPSAARAWAATPTFSIVSVVPDQSVTIKTANFPAKQTFTVRMGPIGTRGVNGTVVGTTESGAGGSFTATYNIPAGLKGSKMISIRMDSPQGYFAYNWFYNTTGSATQTPGPTATSGPSPTPGPTSTRAPVYTGIPTFSIAAVAKDQTVTIQTKNFPAKQTFTVRMGPMGTRGVNGVVVGTTDSGQGGAFQATYNIPSSLAGSHQISIRMESPQGYFAYNWFYNSSTGGATPGPTATAGTPAPTRTPGPTSTRVPDYTGIPTFSIASVVRDTSVTIQTNNFPANQTFTARMGPIGSQGVGGTVVGTVDSGKGGAFQATFNVPAGLKGAYQIAIRLESPQGYFAYNWFYNVNSP